MMSILETVCSLVNCLCVHAGKTGIFHQFFLAYYCEPCLGENIMVGMGRRSLMSSLLTLSSAVTEGDIKLPSKKDQYKFAYFFTHIHMNLNFYLTHRLFKRSITVGDCSYANPQTDVGEHSRLPALHSTQFYARQLEFNRIASRAYRQNQALNIIFRVCWKFFT